MNPNSSEKTQLLSCMWSHLRWLLLPLSDLNWALLSRFLKHSWGILKPFYQIPLQQNGLFYWLLQWMWSSHLMRYSTKSLNQPSITKGLVQTTAWTGSCFDTQFRFPDIPDPLPVAYPSSVYLGPDLFWSLLPLASKVMKQS